MFFQNWTDIGRTVVVGALAYIGLVVFLRISGKRTLGTMNAFDMVVTVALGSTLATILLAEDVALAEGLTAFGVLIALQYAITWLSVRHPRITGLVKSPPTLLAYRGEPIRDALRSQRVSQEEVLQAIRQAGHASLADVHAVVLESDGSFAVTPRASGGDDSALRNVANWDRRPGSGRTAS